MHFVIPFGKFGPPYLGKATAAARAALPSPTSAYWVFSCFRNPPNSDVDDMIFNVRTWSFRLMRAYNYTHGGWAHRQSQHNISDFEKLLQFVLLLLAGFEPRVFGFDALPIEPPRHPIYKSAYCTVYFLQQWGTADAEIKAPPHHPPWWEPRAIKGSLFLSLW